MSKHPSKFDANEHIADEGPRDADPSQASAADTPNTATAETSATDAPVEKEAVRARKTWMPKQFLPDGDWIAKNIVANGKGTRATIGRVIGIATRTVRKKGTLPDGSPSETIALEGQFMSESYLTGELSECGVCYFPMAYALKIESVLLSDPTVKIIEVDADIGLEATGKSIPYEWVVIAFRDGAEMSVLKRLRASRQRPQNILTAPGGKPILQLTATTK